jgi:hypothetical protein
MRDETLPLIIICVGIAPEEQDQHGDAHVITIDRDRIAHYPNLTGNDDYENHVKIHRDIPWLTLAELERDVLEQPAALAEQMAQVIRKYATRQSQVAYGYSIRIGCAQVTQVYLPQEWLEKMPDLKQALSVMFPAAEVTSKATA